MRDELIASIANYVATPPQFSEEAYATARLALADALGCAVLARQEPACQWLFDSEMSQAFIFGSLIRWLDYNDTWLAAEWGHPSDNLGGILATANTLDDVLTSMIQAYEIQGVLALSNSYNQVGMDHVIFVKVATAAVTTKLLGGGREQIADAVSQAFIDGAPLRCYRHAPNAGPRKSWAAGLATSRGVEFAKMTLLGEPGYATPLSAKQWGLYDVHFQGKPFTLERPFSSYVMENILFKVSFPAEFHAQTAVEAACQLHHEIDGKLDTIASIEIATQKPAIDIITKSGPLHNPADRDHCLQYMVAVGLLNGTLTEKDYHDPQDPRIDPLREKMTVTEEPTFTHAYYDPEKRAIPNQITVHLKNGSQLGPLTIEYPLGHPKRRAEALPHIWDKCRKNLLSCFSEETTERLLYKFQNLDPDLSTQDLLELILKK